MSLMHKLRDWHFENDLASSNVELTLQDLRLMRHKNVIEKESLFGAVQLAEVIHSERTKQLFDKATTKTNKKVVAVKLSHHELVQSKRSRGGHVVCESPQTEVRMLRKLQRVSQESSPYVVRYLGSGIENQYHYVITEYCNSGELFDLVSSKSYDPNNESGVGGLDVDLARRYFCEIATGVNFLHRNGVAHLDLSLENVMLHDDHIKIIDFGMAREFTHNNSRFPGEQDMIGKEAYCSPEVYNKNMSGFDGRKADIWSLGILLFMMLSGSKPIRYPSKKDNRYSILIKDVSALVSSWDLEDKIDATACDLLKQIFCCEKDRINIEQVLLHPYCQYSIFQNNNQHHHYQEILLDCNSDNNNHNSNKDEEKHLHVSQDVNSSFNYCPSPKAAAPNEVAFIPKDSSIMKKFLNMFTPKYGKLNEWEEELSSLASREETLQ